MKTFDKIVIGSGSAGSVIASRLSENKDSEILLVEAGSDYPEIESMPDEIKYGYKKPKNSESFESYIELGISKHKLSNGKWAVANKENLNLASTGLEIFCSSISLLFSWLIFSLVASLLF